MAKRKATAQSSAEIAVQQQQVQKQLSGVQGGLLNMANVGQDSYLAATGETALTKQALPNFADIYNPLYEKTKDIKYTLGEDATTSVADQAFYVFNAEAEAKKQADAQISVVEKQNEDAAKQQQNIAEFVKQEGEQEKLAIQQQYIQSVINKSSTLSKGFITSADTGFDMNAFKKAKGKNKTISYDANRKPIYSYKLSEEEAAQRLQIVKDTEAMRFKLDSTLQQSETTKYATALQEQLKNIGKSLAKTIKKENKAAAKTEKKEAKAAKKASKNK
jgi:hypothetical protein